MTATVFPNLCLHWDLAASVLGLPPPEDKCESETAENHGIME